MAFKFEVAESKQVELPNGEMIDVREPNIKELRLFREEHMKAKDDDSKQLELTIGFLAELGFPEEYAYKSSDIKLLDFVTWLTSGKKS